MFQATLRMWISPRIASFGFLILACSLAGCESSLTVVDQTPEDARIQKLVVQPGMVSVQLEDSVELLVYGLTASGQTTDVDVTWTTEGGSVKQKGQGKGRWQYKGNKLGKDEVIATDSSGLADTTEVTVVSTPVPVDEQTFACLEAAASVETVTGHHEVEFSPDVAAGKAFDARTADFLVRSPWGTIDIEGSGAEAGMCWAGGYVYSDKPWDASWDDHKDLDGPTRNSVALDNRAYSLVVTGLHSFNVHDGVRTNNAYSWLIQHTWSEYVRDDCIENDHLQSGRVYDVLFDGCYTGVSTRPSSGDPYDGASELVELDRVLLRMQPMPYPYHWSEKSGFVGEDGQPYNGTGIPYGHANIFKLYDDVIERNPHFSLKNSVFLLTHYTKDDYANFPPASLVDACENVTIIWLGGGDYPGQLPTSKFPNCFTLLTGQTGIDYWVDMVSDWHRRHPGVDPERKPTSPGSLDFPRRFEF